MRHAASGVNANDMDYGGRARECGRRHRFGFTSQSNANNRAWRRVQEPMGKPWAWMSIGGGGLLLAGLLTLWNLRTPLPAVRFADGRTTRVRQVSFGTNHVFSAEPIWKQAARRVLPNGWQAWLGPTRIYNRRTDHDCLAVYFEPLPRPLLDPKWRVPVEILFPDGTKHPTERAIQWTPSSEWLILQNYPRGEKEITVRLWDGDHAIRIKVPNPHPVPRAAWRGRDPWRRLTTSGGGK